MTLQVTNLKEFQFQLKAEAAAIIPDRLILFQKKLAMEALVRIVRRTPVDTGRARGNWQLSIGSPRTHEVNVVGGTSGELAITQGLLNLSALKEAFAIVYITNNVEYISYLEEGYGEGKNGSWQAPEGMVAITLAELQEMLEK